MRRSNNDTVRGGVLAENQAKIDSYDKSIKAAQDRKRKIIVESKLYTYDMLSEMFGKEGQELIDEINAEHTLIVKLTESGMSYSDIEGLADSSADKYDKQMSFAESNHSYSE